MEDRERNLQRPQVQRLPPRAQLRPRQAEPRHDVRRHEPARLRTPYGLRLPRTALDQGQNRQTGAYALLRAHQDHHGLSRLSRLGDAHADPDRFKTAAPCRGSTRTMMPVLRSGQLELLECITGLLPELSLIEAHGDMPGAEMDEAMVRFADGGADVLLSTNIVETGLDVPRATTVLVWRPDRFGLSQLHQLRGRVGRGRARGVIYLLTDPAAKPAQATLRRLKTLEALDRVGAGFAISARDLDLRGAGELLGEQQAGHMRLVGLELYRHLLDRALAKARGETPPEAWSPALAVGIDAYVPQDHIPEKALQVDVHARLGRVLRTGDLSAVEALEDELEDRFGEAPEPLRNLFELARLSAR